MNRMHVAAMVAIGFLLPLSGAQAAGPGNSAAIKASIASPERLPSDRAEDEWRQSAAILETLGARPGMHVVDVISGGGYFTELLARVVGPTGSVTAQNPQFFVQRLSARLEERYGNNRLPNVKRLEGGEPADLPENAYDAALLVNIYHDQYVSRPPAPTPNPVPFVAEVFKSLKSGGIALVQDHAANSGGTPIEVATALHRVDPEVVKRDFLAAGFEFDGESGALRNPDDNRSVRVHEQGMLHKTDRFILRFRKP